MEPTARPVRADTRRTHEALLDAMGRLAESNGLAFTLPDLAKEAGVGTATAYRHFEDVHAVRLAFYRRLLGSLVEEFDALCGEFEGLELFGRVCTAWVHSSRDWARAATFIRSAEGYLDRVRAGDPLVVQHHAALSAVLTQLAAAGEIPPQEMDYAVLLWTTVFDERVFLDLEGAYGWTAEQVAERLAGSVLAALRARPS